MTRPFHPRFLWPLAAMSTVVMACAAQDDLETEPLGPPQLTPQRSGTAARLQAVSVVNEQVVWASGVSATVTRSLDGGATWRTSIVPGPSDLEFRDIHAVSADTAFILSSGTGDASRIYRTTDGGRSWTLQFSNEEPEAFFDCFDFWDSSNGLAYSDAVNGELIVVRTTDGERWRRLPRLTLPPARGSEGGFASSGTCLLAQGDQRAWIGTGAGDTARVLSTLDRGATWYAAELPIISGTPNSGVFSLAFFDENHGLALGGSLADTAAFTNNVAVTRDAGQTWALAGHPAFVGAVYGASVVPGMPTNTVVAVGPKGMSFSVDGAQTWAPLATLSHWAVAFASPRAGWSVGPEGRITKISWPATSAPVR